MRAAFVLLAATVAGSAMAQPLVQRGTPAMAEPYATESVVNHPVVIGWPEGRTPTAPRGWEVVAFASGLENPRQVLELPNGDVLAAEARQKPKLDEEPEAARGFARSNVTGWSPNRIILLRDTDRDGVADERHVLVENLNQPFGMAFADGRLYVANTDAVVSYPFQPGQTRITAPSRKLIDLPAGGYNNHWTRNLELSPDGRTLFVSVGSASNVGENGMEEEERRAAILAVDLRTGRERLYATGLRNPVGMDIAADGTLWTAVNERDEFGDDISPDYLVGVREGGFYGWPYSYWGRQDPRHANTRRDLLATTLKPDVAVGPHAAALGFALSPEESGRQYGYVARHGSWNRAAFSGYDVLVLPYENGRPAADPQPFLTGFIADERAKQVYGRPVSVRSRADGSLFVVDDNGNTIWLARRAR
ncbi:glucose/arabinose dehydrogenase [Sphingomonas jejuensis]|uniref:Glucose/arabinose dehydrogenase n=1 Tax=Sphingomonas jejuensis TaxID=904715 RepID=A0ABX0XJI7_9SPHN|nr:sorbosone dehydrogenase family protein [Sphingomonas jejuensis]NJC33394.1 glucose/arabinose dehydrogenase [Sphingomonas jejuensis]